MVLYFFPAAFTTGCTIEAHEFADAAADYKALGATLIGVTAGNIDRLTEFSVSECRSKFPVAADPNAEDRQASYDSLLAVYPGYSDRTSYVIAPERQGDLRLFRPAAQRPRQPDPGRGQGVARQPSDGLRRQRGRAPFVRGCAASTSPMKGEESVEFHIKTRSPSLPGEVAVRRRRSAGWGRPPHVATMGSG